MLFFFEQSIIYGYFVTPSYLFYSRYPKIRIRAIVPLTPLLGNLNFQPSRPFISTTRSTSLVWFGGTEGPVGYRLSLQALSYILHPNLPTSPANRHEALLDVFSHSTSVLVLGTASLFFLLSPLRGRLIVIKAWNNLLPPDVSPIFNHFYLAQLSSCAPNLRKYVPIATCTVLNWYQQAIFLGVLATLDFFPVAFCFPVPLPWLPSS